MHPIYSDILFYIQKNNVSRRKMTVVTQIHAESSQQVDRYGNSAEFQSILVRNQDDETTHELLQCVTSYGRDNYYVRCSPCPSDNEVEEGSASNSLQIIIGVFIFIVMCIIIAYLCSKIKKLERKLKDVESDQVKESTKTQEKC